jgi:hypothetical protein
MWRPYGFLGAGGHLHLDDPHLQLTLVTPLAPLLHFTLQRMSSSLVEACRKCVCSSVICGSYDPGAVWSAAFAGRQPCPSHGSASRMQGPARNTPASHSADVGSLQEQLFCGSCLHTFCPPQAGTKTLGNMVPAFFTCATSPPILTREANTTRNVQKQMWMFIKS